MNKLEEIIASWYEQVPHLSERTRAWLANNSWWLALVVVVAGILTVVSVLTMSLLAGLLLVSMAGIVGGVAGSVIMLFVALAMILTIINAILLALAVSPLRRKERRGWRLLFAVVLINVLAAVAKVLFDYNLVSLVLSIVLSAIAGYLLFEIRDRFSLFPAVDTPTVGSKASSR